MKRYSHQFSTAVGQRSGRLITVACTQSARCWEVGWLLAMVRTTFTITLSEVVLCHAKPLLLSVSFIALQFGLACVQHGCRPRL